MKNGSGFKARSWCMAAVLGAMTVAAGCGSGDEILGSTPPTSSSGPLGSAGGPLALNLGRATTFGIASQGGMTSTGVTVVNGNIALSPLGTCTDATGVGPAPGTGVPPPGCAVEAYGAHPTGLTVVGS